MTPKKRRVDKNAVKYDLAIGKYPGEIANVWGVSRQYISSIRQELVKEGVLKRGKLGRPKRPHLPKTDEGLEISDIRQFIERILSMKHKMRKLEIEREHYKQAYEFVFDELSQYLNEEEKQHIMFMTAHNEDVPSYLVPDEPIVVYAPKEKANEKR